MNALMRCTKTQKSFAMKDCVLLFQIDQAASVELSFFKNKQTMLVLVETMGIFEQKWLSDLRLQKNKTKIIDDVLFNNYF